MFNFAQVTLPPALVVAWALAGVLAAYVGWSVKGGGRIRLAADSAVGILGAMLGGLAASLLVGEGAAKLGSVAAAFLSGWAFVAFAHTAPARRRI
jgi:hypothetical protein